MFGSAQIRNGCDTAEEIDKLLLANGALKYLIYLVTLHDLRHVAPQIGSNSIVGGCSETVVSCNVLINTSTALASQPAHRPIQVESLLAV